MCIGEPAVFCHRHWPIHLSGNVGPVFSLSLTTSQTTPNSYVKLVISVDDIGPESARPSFAASGNFYDTQPLGVNRFSSRGSGAAAFVAATEPSVTKR